MFVIQHPSATIEARMVFGRHWADDMISDCEIDHIRPNSRNPESLIEFRGDLKVFGIDDAARRLLKRRQGKQKDFRVEAADHLIVWLRM